MIRAELEYLLMLAGQGPLDQLNGKNGCRFLSDMQGTKQL